MSKQEWKILLDVLFTNINTIDYILINEKLHEIGSYIMFSKEQIYDLFFDFLNDQENYEESYEESFIQNQKIKYFMKIFNLKLKFIKEQDLQVHNHFTSANFIYEVVFADEHLCYLQVSDVKNITNESMTRNDLSESWSVREVEKTTKVIETYD